MLLYYVFNAGAYPSNGVFFAGLAVKISNVGVTWRRCCRKEGLGLILILILLSTSALATSATIERTSPETRTAPPGKIITHIFAITGQGEAVPKFDSEHSWPILTNERPLSLDPQKATFLAISIRVPPNALEGSRDRLTVQIGGVQAYAYSQAAFQPGLRASWPQSVDYLPPIGYLQLSLQNTGNGSDTYLIQLNTITNEPVFSGRVELEAGATTKMRIPVAKYGTLKIKIVSTRSELKKEGSVIVRQAPTQINGTYRLIGRLGAAYNYPNSFSVSAGLAGPLSDFAYFSFGIGYALGSTPSGSANINFDNGYFSISYGTNYGVALGLYEKNVSVAMSLSGPNPRGSFNIDLYTHSANYGLAANFNPNPSFRFSAQIGLGDQVGATHADFESDALLGELTFLPLETRIYGGITYAFHYRKRPLRLAFWADWKKNEQLINKFAADANLHEADFGGWLSWAGLGIRDWEVALTSNSKRLQVKSSLPFYLGISAGANRLRAFAGTTLHLPHPWRDLRGLAEIGYAGGSWSFTISNLGRAIGFKGLAWWELGSEIGWPLEKNVFSVGIRTGGPYLRGRARLDWAPWKPSADTRVSLELPVAGAMLRASFNREWYSGKTSFGMSADLPLLVTVPTPITQAFGGRRVGKIVGIVEVDGPEEFRQGIVVRAGGEVATTDAEGKFQLLLPPGEYKVEIDRSRLPVVLVAVKASQKVNVYLKKTVRVSLRVAVRSLLEGKVVVQGKYSRGLPRFAVAVKDNYGHETSFYVSKKGTFRLEGLPPGVYTVKLLVNLLPPGWRALKAETMVVLEPGKTGKAELAVMAPERSIYGGGVQILSVKPEVDRAPPGSAPLVTVELKGKADQVLVMAGNQVVGVLKPSNDKGVWKGRIKLAKSYVGPLQLNIVARAGDQEARFPFFITADKAAPWGVVRTAPVAQPGQILPLVIHWYTPVDECRVEIAGQHTVLKGKEADWQGKIKIPPDIATNKILITLSARLMTGQIIKIKKWLFLRK